MNVLAPSKPWFTALLCLAFGLWPAGPASAQASYDMERAQIDEGRKEAEERFRMRERECRDRFIVTSCVEDAQRERRSTLDALRARQLKLDEARRRTRAAERSAEIAAKVAEDAKRAEQAQGRAARPSPEVREPREAREPRQPRQARPIKEALPSTGAKAKPKPAVQDEAERRANEARSRSEFEARQRKAAEHRASSLDRTIKRMHERDPADPLPTPSASAVRAIRPASAP